MFVDFGTSKTLVVSSLIILQLTVVHIPEAPN